MNREGKALNILLCAERRPVIVVVHLSFCVCVCVFNFKRVNHCIQTIPQEHISSHYSLFIG